MKLQAFLKVLGVTSIESPVMAKQNIDIIGQKSSSPASRV
jgi:hypothetical protein